MSLDRDFGFFGEYNLGEGDGFNLSAKGSVTLGEGRNWGNSTDGGLAYTGRLELYPLGRFGAQGDLLEGDFDYEEQVRILLAGAWSFNDNATRFQGQRGAMMPEGETRDINSYFVDFILKYRGFSSINGWFAFITSAIFCRFSNFFNCSRFSEISFLQTDTTPFSSSSLSCRSSIVSIL